MVKNIKLLAILFLLFVLAITACNKNGSTDTQISITGQWKLDSMVIKLYKNDQLINVGTSVAQNYFINFNTDGTYSETVNGEKAELGTYSYKAGDNKITFSSEEITGDVPITKLSNSQLNFWINSTSVSPSQTDYNRQEGYFFLSR